MGVASVEIPAATPVEAVAKEEQCWQEAGEPAEADQEQETTQPLQPFYAQNSWSQIDLESEPKDVAPSQSEFETSKEGSLPKDQHASMPMAMPGGVFRFGANPMD